MLRSNKARLAINALDKQELELCLKLLENDNSIESYLEKAEIMRLLNREEESYILLSYLSALFCPAHLHKELQRISIGVELDLGYLLEAYNRVLKETTMIIEQARDEILLNPKSLSIFSFSELITFAEACIYWAEIEKAENFLEQASKIAKNQIEEFTVKFWGILAYYSLIELNKQTNEKVENKREVMTRLHNQILYLKIDYPLLTEKIKACLYGQSNLNTKQTIRLYKLFNENLLTEISHQKATETKKKTKPVQNTNLEKLVQVPKQNNRVHDFAGSLKFIDLFLILDQAKSVQLTGFFEIEWDPKCLILDLKAKKVTDKITQGKGYIFIVNGIIVDASIGDFETVNTEQQAIENLQLIIRIAFNISLDKDSNAVATFYESERIRNRPQAMQLDSSSIYHMIVELEEQFN